MESMWRNFLTSFSKVSRTRVEASSRKVREVDAVLMTDTSLRLDRVESISDDTMPGTSSN